MFRDYEAVNVGNLWCSFCFVDPRVEGYFMMSSPLASLVICLAYVYIVQVALPRFMESRAPLELRRLMIVYNFAMVALSGYIFMEVGCIVLYSIILYYNVLYRA